jgi:hypothetical protein
MMVARDGVNRRRQPFQGCSHPSLSSCNPYLYRLSCPHFDRSYWTHNGPNNQTHADTGVRPDSDRANGSYLPAESNTGMFGGNSNWRGPIWMPVNLLIIRALTNFYLYYGDNFKIECPTGSGKMMNLFEVSKEIADRLARIFTRNEHGRRPVYGGTEKFQSDRHWRDHILFYEYFHGDNGAGLGASHQTGWTGLVAKTLQIYGLLDAKGFLEGGKQAAFAKGAQAKAA